jgi:NADPH:quinone reductase-like Zn-dependent oxidoreductase
VLHCTANSLLAVQPRALAVLLQSNTPERTAKILSVLKPCGHYSHIRNSAGPSAGSDTEALLQKQAAHKDGKGPSVSITLVAPNGKQLEHLFSLWEVGELKLEVAQVFPLAQIADAHRQVETGHTRGKVVLAIPQ